MSDDVLMLDSILAKELEPGMDLDDGYYNGRVFWRRVVRVDHRSDIVDCSFGHILKTMRADSRVTIRLSVEAHRRRQDAARLRAEVEASENWYAEELERLRERAPA